MATMRAISSSVSPKSKTSMFSHPLGPPGLRDDDDVALDEPARDDLSDGLVVPGAGLAEDRVGEDVVLAFGEGAPGFDLHAVLAHDRLVGCALVNGWVSTWLTAGVTSSWATRSTSRSG